jgi:hypothetical protein
MVVKPEERRLLVRSRRRWEDNIKMDVREVVASMDWIDLAIDVAGCCERGNEPSGSIECGEFD